MNECSKTWLSRGTLVPNKKYSEAKEQPKILFSYNSTKCGYWKWSQTCHKRQDFPQLLCWRLASTGYHKMPKMPSTGWITRGHLFLTGVEAGESKIKVPADLVSGESPLPGSQIATFRLCPPAVEGQGSSPRRLWQGPQSSLWGLHPPHLIICQRPHLQYHITLVVKISTYEFGGT